MSHKKAIYLICDGLGDRPIAALGGQTPLEYAATPHLDFLCQSGVSGLVHPYRAGCCVGTDWGHICLFGYDPERYYTGRGAVEAASAGFVLEAGDVAFRGNLATVDNCLTVTDRRAGRIHDAGQIAALTSAVDGIELEGCTFFLRPLTQHRVAVIMRGSSLCWQIPDTDPGTTCEGSRVVRPMDDLTDPKAKETARVLWQFLQKVNQIWNTHPINQQRKAADLLPANFILTRGAAAAMVLPPITQLFPKVRVSCIAGDETILGIGKMCGFDTLHRPSFTGGFDTDYRGKAELALRCLDDHDLVIVHVKGTDLCGHDNQPLKKAQIIQRVDEMFGYWRANTAAQDMYFALAADHSTPCHVGDHSADPVPALLWGEHLRVDTTQRFGERFVQPGLLTGYTGSQLMGSLMDLLGHSKKYGA